MPTTTRCALTALLAIAAFAGGCIARPEPPGSDAPGSDAPARTSAGPLGSSSPVPLASTEGGPTDSPPPIDPLPTAVADPALAKLDPTSRELLAVVERGELIEAVVEVADAADLVAWAKRRGGRGDVLSPDAAFVVVERGLIAALLRNPGVRGANLAEDLRADRPIAAERPVVALPTPGSPYAGRPLPDGPELAEMPDERRAPLLAALGNAIVTIDGQPYRELVIGGHCQLDLCHVSATGRVRAAGDVFDGWLMGGYANRGWLPTLSRSGTQLGGVPRPLARAAEWIARNDRPTARAIGRYDSISSIRWEPASPGVIEIAYQAECTATSRAAPPGTKVAEDGVCIDMLLVRVDVASGIVVETVEVPDS